MSLLSDIGTAIKNKLGGTSVDNTVPRYDGTTCKLQGSGVTISDTNAVIASGGFVGNLTGNASTATKLNNSANDWSASGAITSVVGMLSWKNFGDGHVIFDASNGTAPNGEAVNNTNSTSPWGPSYPSLMGWNGISTYGLRVDSARVADYVPNCVYTTAFTGGNQSLASNGYQKLPGGLIIQWGLDRPYDGAFGRYALTVNFPIAFPNACFLVNGHSQTSYSGSADPIYSAISSWNTTSFVRPWWMGRMAWTAIGY